MNAAVTVSANHNADLVGAFISKAHSEAEPGFGSPGVGDYKISRNVLDPKVGKHFGTATKDLIPSAPF